jgi:hypothetical protein
MSEPTIPPPAEPFAAAPVEPRAGGCSKPLLIGCGVVFLLLGVAGLLFVMKARDLLVWSLDKTRAGVLDNLAEDVTAADRERFDAAYAAATVRIRDGKIDAAALQKLQGELMRAIENPREKVTREKFLALTEALEKVGGVEPPAPVETPAAPESPEATPPEAPGQGTARIRAPSPSGRGLG